MLLLNKLNSNVAHFTPQEQAFSQTLKTGHPEGMFPIKRLSEFPCIPSKKRVSMGWVHTLLARNCLATNEVAVGCENLLQNVES